MAASALVGALVGFGLGVGVTNSGTLYRYQAITENPRVIGANQFIAGRLNDLFAHRWELDRVVVGSGERSDLPEWTTYVLKRPVWWID